MNKSQDDQWDELELDIETFQESGANVHSLPDWCYAQFRVDIDGAPEKWQGNTLGQWKRRGLVPYGKAREEYLEKYFVCPECNCCIQPHQEQENRFYCEGCYLLLHWSFGGLWGYGVDSSKAEFLNQ